MILIKDKEMPKICAYCFLDESECNLHKSVNIWKEKHPDCPLIEIPAPYGRLIDADALKNDMRDWNPSIIAVVDAMPTVIEAEGSET